uniref:Uncharacterized protein n=1 Tax=viral metagenome TaxID=1070528 RepID=A0A6C0H302_9ZZZZ
MDICNTLLNYYNTSVLTNADSTLKSALLEEARKCADENPIKRVGQPMVELERTVLKRLIINKETNKKPNVDCIGGPFTLTMHWSKYYKKLIYIFGEEHDNVTNCPPELPKKMNIEKYLLDFFKNTDVFYDFYLEVRPFNKQTGDYGFQFSGAGRITKIMMEDQHFVQNCIQSRTRNKIKCELGRIHFIDIRKNENVKINNASVFSNLFDILDEKHIFKVYNQEYKEGIDDPSKKFIKIEKDPRYQTFLCDFFKNDQVRTCIIEFSKIENEEQYYHFWYKEFNNYTFNIEKIKKSFIGKEIINFINDQIKLLFFNKKINNMAKEIVTNITYIETTCDIITTSDYSAMLYFLREVSDFLIDANYLVMDGYLLARVFKDFDINSVNTEKQRSTDEPKSPHNIIIYAGDKHCTTYRKFLEDELGFELIEEAGVKWRDTDTHTGKITFSSDMEDAPKHIDMTQFPQPFFSHHSKVDWTFVNTPTMETETETETETRMETDENDDYDDYKIKIRKSSKRKKDDKKPNSPKSGIEKVKPKKPNSRKLKKKNQYDEEIMKE